MLGLISKEIYKNGTQYNNTSELEKAVTAAWANLKTDFLSNLTATMKDRVFQLIASCAGKIYKILNVVFFTDRAICNRASDS